DGRPRLLHVEESLQCIDFSDCEPVMDDAQGELLVGCDHFRVEKWSLSSGETRTIVNEDTFALITVVSGELACSEKSFYPGASFLIPAASEEALRKVCAGEKGAEVLRTRLPIQ